MKTKCEETMKIIKGRYDSLMLLGKVTSNMIGFNEADKKEDGIKISGNSVN